MSRPTLLFNEEDEIRIRDAFVEAMAAATKDPKAKIFAIVPNGAGHFKDAVMVVKGKRKAKEMLLQVGLRASHHVEDF